MIFINGFISNHQPCKYLSGLFLIHQNGFSRSNTSLFICNFGTSEIRRFPNSIPPSINIRNLFLYESSKSRAEDVTVEDSAGVRNASSTIGCDGGIRVEEESKLGRGLSSEIMDSNQKQAETIHLPEHYPSSSCSSFCATSGLSFSQSLSLSITSAEMRSPQSLRRCSVDASPSNPSPYSLSVHRYNTEAPAIQHADSRVPTCRFFASLLLPQFS